jgi:hypothetical protein
MVKIALIDESRMSGIRKYAGAARVVYAAMGNLAVGNAIALIGTTRLDSMAIALLPAYLRMPLLRCAPLAAFITPRERGRGGCQC